MHEIINLKCPKFIQKYKNNTEFVSIDKDIVDTIKYLWKNKIETLGSCCGIGREYGNKPNIVIPECYTDNDIEKIKKIISEVDDRKWIIFQWRNVVVSRKTKPKRLLSNFNDKLK